MNQKALVRAQVTTAVTRTMTKVLNRSTPAQRNLFPTRSVRPPMTGRVHIGCSGWIYRHWRELFYPAKLAQRHWFAHYSDTFRTVELNTSFYHLPKPDIG